MQDVGDRGAQDADWIDAVMRIEPAVFDGDEGFRQIRRQVLQRDQIAAPCVRSFPDPTPCATLVTKSRPHASVRSLRCSYEEVKARLVHDPEKWLPVFPRDKRGTRLRRSCSNKRLE